MFLLRHIKDENTFVELWNNHTHNPLHSNLAFRKMYPHTKNMNLRTNSTKATLETILKEKQMKHQTLCLFIKRAQTKIHWKSSEVGKVSSIHTHLNSASMCNTLSITHHSYMLGMGEIEQLTLWLVDDPPYLLSHSCSRSLFKIISQSLSGNQVVWSSQRQKQSSEISLTDLVKQQADRRAKICIVPPEIQSKLTSIRCNATGFWTNNTWVNFDIRTEMPQKSHRLALREVWCGCVLVARCVCLFGGSVSK